MPTDVDLYAILGVAPTATHAEVKKAHRIRQRESHPDTGGSNERFRTVQDAWDVLGNPGRRRNYDADRKAGSSRSTSAPTAPSDYQRAWAAGGSAKVHAEYARREREETARWNEMYSEQNEWFERAKRRSAEYAASPADDEFDVKPRPVIEGLTAVWLRWLYLALVVLNTAALLSVASTPEILLTILPGLGFADAVVVLGSLLVSVFFSVRFYSSDSFVRLVTLSGVIAVIMLGAFLVGTATLITFGDIQFLGAT